MILASITSTPPGITDTPRETPKAPSGAPDPARIGRRVGAAVFWVLCVWIIALGAGSVIKQLFFTPHVAASSPRDTR